MTCFLQVCKPPTSLRNSQIVRLVEYTLVVQHVINSPYLILTRSRISNDQFFFTNLIPYPRRSAIYMGLIFAGGTQQGTRMPPYVNLPRSSKSRNPLLGSPTIGEEKPKE
ncbi:hypothetical protein EVAR_20594_1 [Eumeta japonica]|uniref:Uncharacterized protein n=1 Tax=Eumeta variegata TaxID=151549 RepID=A0A4C1URZ1_EUMVA|nr:hypothetical protein EVAR_20594_1 [Eumeta japonica]